MRDVSCLSRVNPRLPKTKAVVGGCVRVGTNIQLRAQIESKHSSAVVSNSIPFGADSELLLEVRYSTVVQDCRCTLLVVRPVSWRASCCCINPWFEMNKYLESTRLARALCALLAFSEKKRSFFSHKGGVGSRFLRIPVVDVLTRTPKVHIDLPR